MVLMNNLTPAIAHKSDDKETEKYDALMDEIRTIEREKENSKIDDS